jgi:hypothetical protein
MCLLYKGPSHLNSSVPTDRRTSMLCLSKELAFVSLEAARSAKGAVFDYSQSVGVSWDTLGEPTVTVSSAIMVHDTSYAMGIRPIRLGIPTVC